MNATNLVPAPHFSRLSRSPRPSVVPRVLAAIEIGPDMVRLKIVRMRATGGLETIHEESAPGPLWDKGAEAAPVGPTVAFLIATLGRYLGLCRARGALLRTVATGTFRRLTGCDDIAARVHGETGIDVELICSREESRLLSLAALRGTPEGTRSLVISAGVDGVLAILAAGDQPIAIWELILQAKQAVPALGLTGATQPGDLAIALRTQARKIVSRARLGALCWGIQSVVVTAGPARLAASEAGTGVVLPGEIITEAIMRAIMRAILQSTIQATTERSLHRLSAPSLRVVNARLGDGVIDGLADTCRSPEWAARRPAEA